ncbi:MAG TPA: ABC transporter permease [Stellaceae bacterium]|nr:ABC transporter permease [Stellaceae bacterium]
MSMRPALGSAWRALGERRVTALSLLVLVLAWIGATEGGLVDDLFLPGPASLWSGFLDLVENGYKSRTIWEHAALSLERVLAGFVTGAVAGTLVGLGMGYNRKIEAFFSPLVEFFRPLPQLAYLVLLIVWFGIGETPQIILLFLTAFPVSAIAAMDGVKSVSVLRMQAARSMGASEWQVFRYVVFPSALHEIFTGARLAIGVVYATLIAAEIIAGSTGLGWVILDAGRFLRSDYVFVGILMIGVMGLVLDRLLLTFEHRIVHWAGRD